MRRTMDNDKPVNAGSRPVLSPLEQLHQWLRGRYVIAVLTALISSAGAATVAFKAMDPMYESTGVIQIAPAVARILYESDQNGMIPMYESFMASQVALLKSQRMAEDAQNRVEWFDLGRPSGREAIPQFMQALTIIHPEKSQLLSVSFRDPDPRAAQAAVQAVIRAYVNMNAQVVADEHGKRLRVLHDRQTSLEQRRRDQQIQVDAIVRELTVESQTRNETYPLLQMDTLDSMAMARIAELASQPAGLLPMTDLNSAAEAASRNQRRVRLLSERDAAEREHRALESRFGSDHVETRRAGERVVAIEYQIAKLREEFAAVPDQLARKAQVEALISEISQLDQLLQETRRGIDAMNVEAEAASRVTIMTEAEVPLTPINTGRRIQLASASGLAAASLAVASVIVLCTMGRRAWRIDDAMSTFGNDAILGAIPRLKSRHVPLYQPDRHVHSIRTWLAARSSRDRATVFTVTSADQRAGKTTTAAALAKSFALAGKKTLLIDLDLFRGNLASVVECPADHPPQRDLIDYVQGESLTSCLRQTSHARLFILSSNGPGSMDLAHLGYDTLRELLHQAAAQFEVVIIDTPALLKSLEASLACSLSDEVIMIVRRGSRMSHTMRALAHLRSCEARVAGLVFNCARRRDLRRLDEAGLQYQTQPRNKHAARPVEPRDAVPASCEAVRKPLSSQKHAQLITGTGEPHPSIIRPA